MDGSTHLLGIVLSAFLLGVAVGYAICRWRYGL